MTTLSQAELRSGLIQSVELTAATELTGKRLVRIDDVVFEALIANGASPQDADLNLCKDLVVRVARAAGRLPESRDLVAS